MPSIQVDPAHVHAFPDAAHFEAWLSKHHDREAEVWIKIHKLASGLPSITPKEAIDVVLCWGWIDAVRKGFDEDSFLQRYTPRGRRSIWSQINVDNVARLIAQGRMTGHGLKEVEAAKADGRWDRAYGSGKDFAIPDDLQAAIDASPKAKAFLPLLSEQNRFCSGLPHPQHEDPGGAGETHRRLRRDAGEGRDRPSTEGQDAAGLTAPG